MTKLEVGRVARDNYVDTGYKITISSEEDLSPVAYKKVVEAIEIIKSILNPYIFRKNIGIRARQEADKAKAKSKEENKL